MEEKENFLVREVFNKKIVEKLASLIKENYPAFNTEAFIELCMENFHVLSFKERSKAITNALREYLPTNYPKAINILIDSLIPEIEGDELIGIEQERFMILPLTGYISTYGLEDYEISIKGLYEMTKRFSAEFDIRYFINKYPDQMYDKLQEWALDSNCHVRRLVTEGTRPRLPWGMRLDRYITDPLPVLKLLNLLKNDPKTLVQRSLANNLNDIAKDHPSLVINTLKSWQEEGSLNEYILKHALRTLVKQGNFEALSLLGINKEAKISLTDFQICKTSLKMGEKLDFYSELQNESTADELVIVDFVVFYLKANKNHSPKVFKWKQMNLKPNETLKLTKQHLFADFTTRKHYIGPHKIAIQVNGNMLKTLEFELNPF